LLDIYTPIDKTSIPARDVSYSPPPNEICIYGHLQKFIKITKVKKLVKTIGALCQFVWK